MNHIQEWFERIAGISREERDRREFSRELFGKPQFDPSVFQKPACWRRKAAACRRIIVR
jgi:hypothetical protein